MVVCPDHFALTHFVHDFVECPVNLTRNSVVQGCRRAGRRLRKTVGGEYMALSATDEGPSGIHIVLMNESYLRLDTDVRKGRFQDATLPQGIDKLQQ